MVNERVKLLIQKKFVDYIAEQYPDMTASIAMNQFLYDQIKDKCDSIHRGKNEAIETRS